MRVRVRPYALGAISVLILHPNPSVLECAFDLAIVVLSEARRFSIIARAFVLRERGIGAADEEDRPEETRGRTEHIAHENRAIDRRAVHRHPTFGGNCRDKRGYCETIRRGHQGPNHHHGDTTTETQPRPRRPDGDQHDADGDVPCVRRRQTSIVAGRSVR
jgi:hypothetical protein